MPKIDNPKLDLRFRALEAIPDRVPPMFTTAPGVGPGGDGPPEYRAIVLLVPGATRSALGIPGAVDLLDDTFAMSGSVDRLNWLASDRRVRYIEAFRTAVGELDGSVPAIGADLPWAPPSSLTGRGVIVGIVDDGLDITHGDFIDANGNSRVLALWDQNLLPQGAEHPPAGFTYGVEYSRADITAAWNSPMAPQIQHVTSMHGTHVTGIAAGSGLNGAAAYRGIAHEADIVFVSAAAPGTRVSSSVQIAEAVSYILNVAWSEDRPVVINVSMGHNGGRHDGESVVERTVDRLLEREGCAFVKSAGNEARWRTHTSGHIRTMEEDEIIEWEVFQNDRTPNELEIWYSSRDSFRVEVSDPNGNWTTPVDPGNYRTAHNLANLVHIESERFHPLTGHARILIRVGDAPPAVPAVLQGTWKIRLKALELVEGEFDAWIELDIRDPLNGDCDQSQFVSATAEKSLTPPGTIRRGVAVAAYDHRAIPAAVVTGSGRGPTGDGRPKPELTAPGAGIMSSDGNVPRGASMHVSMSGTSMSAPHVTGVIAQMLQKQPALTAAQIRAMLIASASRPGFVPMAFDPAWGFGVVDAMAAVKLIP